MSAPVKKTRLAHFLEAYQPIDPVVEQRIWDRVHRAGLSAEDPASWQIAHETIIEARMVAHAETIGNLPPRVARVLKTSFAEVQEEHTRALAGQNEAIADRVAQEAGAALRAGMPALVRQFHWRVALHLIRTFLLVAVLLAGSGTGLGYVIGRAETSAYQDQYTNLATRPDASRWITLQRANGNLDKLIIEHCSPGQDHRISTETGRRGCAIPLWLDGHSAPAPAGVTGQAGEHLTSHLADTPFGVILLFGFALGIVFVFIAHRVSQWVFD